MPSVMGLMAESTCKEVNFRNMMLFRPAGRREERESDVLWFHGLSISDLRQHHALVPYVQLRARIAHHTPATGTFLDRCVRHTAAELDGHIADTQSMARLGVYLNAVSGAVSRYREALRQPVQQHATYTSTTQAMVVIVYDLIAQLVILHTIAACIPRLRTTLWQVMGRMVVKPSAAGTTAGDGDATSEEASEENEMTTTDMVLDEFRGRPQSVNRLVATTTRTMYQRKLYFKSSITEYQGLQKRVIPESVRHDVEGYLHLCHLVDTTAKTRREMYRNVTCDATYNALKETDNPKWYRDVYLIHANITDQQCLPCIRHLEPALLADFEVMSETFNKMGLSMNENQHMQQSAQRTPCPRMNFLNSNYVLFQLLRKNNYRCEFSSFYCLRTLASRLLHDSICERIFAHLGWPFTTTT
jgi:hypothetical protein